MESKFQNRCKLNGNNIFPVFETKKVFWLETYRWLPQNKPKALVFVIPGYGQYADSVAFLAQELVQRDFAAFGMDLQGFGRSEGLRGYIENLNETANDYLQYIESVQQEFPDSKTFLIGGSLGGLLSTLMGLRKEFSGLVLIAPALKLSEQLQPWITEVLNF